MRELLHRIRKYKEPGILADLQGILSHGDNHMHDTQVNIHITGRAAGIAIDPQPRLLQELVPMLGRCKGLHPRMRTQKVIS